ncbi:SDR family NAD(P)-dependent oxidoreductase, partial [Nocardiopsis mangrovi]
SGDEDAVVGVVDRLAGQGVRARRLRVSHAFHSARMEPMLGEFEEVLGGVSFAEPRLAVVSNVTGRVAEAGLLTDPGYWVRQVRCPVRFADGVAAAREAGATAFLELGPGGTLSAMARQALRDTADDDVLCAPMLRRDRDEVTTSLTALARMHVRGTDIAWAEVIRGGGARRVDLPTYAFQHRRYWPDTPPAPSGRAGAEGAMAAAGLSVTGHPVLVAASPLPGSGGLLLTGRLAPSAHPWAAGHHMGGVGIAPPGVLPELVIRAADEAGCDTVHHLAVEEPIALSAEGAVRVQITVTAADDAGRRRAEVHTRLDDAVPDAPWTRNARAVLGACGPPPPAPEGPETVASWPPEGAHPVDTAAFEEDLRDAGLSCGPGPDLLAAVWRLGDTVHAEIDLGAEPDDAPDEDHRFALHPSVLGAAVHLAALCVDPGTAPRRILQAAEWSGLVLHASGATRLRARAVATGDSTVSLDLADGTGRPVASVASLTLRPAAAQPAPPVPGVVARSLLRLGWIEAPAPPPAAPGAGRWALLGPADHPAVRSAGLDDGPAPAFDDIESLADAVEDGMPAPELLLFDAGAAHGAPEPGAAPAAVACVLGVVQEWAAEAGLLGTRLAVLTRGAVAAGGSAPAPDPVGAAVWGLLRSAQAEYPGRILLFDTDDGTDPARAARRLLPALAASGESQVALRGGTVLVPRLERMTVPDDPARPPLSSGGTVLVTGGTGALGGEVACHLATAHGVRRLLLVSRRGPAADGAASLAARLEALGAEVAVEACDVADRAGLARLLDAIPAEQPLRAVVHTAGVVDDGLISGMTPERIDTVFGPKSEAALNLDALTRGLDLDAFVLFSSAAGVLGSPGQGNYAAANAFLDALAQRRRAVGLAGTSLAWGQWERSGGLSGRLGRADLARMARQGLRALSTAEGMALFDAALASGEAAVVPVHLDTAAVRAHAARAFGGTVAPVLRGLVRPPRRAVRGPAGGGPGERDGLARRISRLPESEGHRLLLDRVLDTAALVLGRSAADRMAPDDAFFDAGFDSLTTLEFGGRLGAATGTAVGSALIFDHPTPDMLTRHLLPLVAAAGGPAAGSVLDDLDGVARTISAAELDPALRAKVAARLAEMAERVR